MPGPRTREALPRFIEPMLVAGCRGELPAGDNWSFEVKWDGMRAQLRADRGHVTLRSRPGRDCTAEFPELAELGEVLRRRRVLLDGELMCLAGDGKPDFSRLRARLGGRTSQRSAPRTAPATFVAFDLLHLDGESTRPLPYEERRRLLEDLELDAASDRCWVPRPVADGTALTAACREQELEGVVAKRLRTRYLPGRRGDAWLKLKLRRREVFIVAGYSVAAPDRPDELFLARTREDGELVPAGSTGYGALDRASRERLRAVLAELTLPDHRGRRRRMRRIESGLWVDVDAHGRRGGVVRDPVVRGFRVDGAEAAA